MKKGFLVGGTAPEGRRGQRSDAPTTRTRASARASAGAAAESGVREGGNSSAVGTCVPELDLIVEDASAVLDRVAVSRGAGLANFAHVASAAKAGTGAARRPSVCYVGGSITEQKRGWRKTVHERLEQRFGSQSYDFLNACTLLFSPA